MSIRWLEAIMLGQEDKFNKRLKDISENGHEIVGLMREGEQETWGEKTNNYRTRLLDIRSFFDSLALFQSADDHADVFGVTPSQQACRYLMIDSGISKFPKSTRQRGKYFGLDCPASDIFALNAPRKMSSQ
ncbi:MAG: hypothetical protein K0U24_06635 [Gammaproteobacteria bacterium]|nr:hypothetical protein [Gammaproteobacteria bacterium]